MAVFAALWSGPAFACCGNATAAFLEARARHANLALTVQGLSVALGFLGLAHALRGRRWLLSLAWVALLGAAPSLAIEAAHDCASVLPAMYSFQLAALLTLGLAQHPSGAPWSHRAQGLLLAASGASAIADWSLVSFEPSYWTGYHEGWRLLLIPAWAAWNWFWSWLLARPLLRAARNWRGLDLVERRVLVVGSMGAVLLGGFAAVVSAALLVRGWESLEWAAPAVIRFLLEPSTPTS